MCWHLNPTKIPPEPNDSGGSLCGRLGPLVGAIQESPAACGEYHVRIVGPAFAYHCHCEVPKATWQSVLFPSTEGTGGTECRRGCGLPPAFGHPLINAGGKKRAYASSQSFSRSWQENSRIWRFSLSSSSSSIVRSMRSWSKRTRASSRIRGLSGERTSHTASRRAR